MNTSKYMYISSDLNAEIYYFFSFTCIKWGFLTYIISCKFSAVSIIKQTSKNFGNWKNWLLYHYNLTICNVQYQISEAVLVPKTTTLWNDEEDVQPSSIPTSPFLSIYPTFFGKEPSPLNPQQKHLGEGYIIYRHAVPKF